VPVATGRRQVLGDQDRNDERVDGNDTGHDDGDQALEMLDEDGSCRTRLGTWGDAYLHDQVWPEGTDTSDADARLGRAVCSAHAYRMALETISSVFLSVSITSKCAVYIAFEDDKGREVRSRFGSWRGELRRTSENHGTRNAGLERRKG
jgi:hypothetical protein